VGIRRAMSGRSTATDAAFPAESVSTVATIEWRGHPDRSAVLAERYDCDRIPRQTLRTGGIVHIHLGSTPVAGGIVSSRGSSDRESADV